MSDTLTPADHHFGTLDAVTWARMSTSPTHYEVVRAFVDRTLAPQRVELNTWTYLTPANEGSRRRMLIEYGLSNFGVQVRRSPGELTMSGLGFLVSETAFDELPPTFWQPISWHKEFNWCLIEQVAGHCGSMQPFGRTYHLVVQ